MAVVVVVRSAEVAAAPLELTPAPWIPLELNHQSEDQLRSTKVLDHQSGPLFGPLQVVLLFQVSPHTRTCSARAQRTLPRRALIQNNGVL